MELGFAFFFNSILLGIGLAMDAFSVSLANGLNQPSMKKSKMSVIAGVFSFFQFIMPMIGWICVKTLVHIFTIFERFVPWIALLLLSFIGGKMIYEGVKSKESSSEQKELSFLVLLMQGIATSIDALSVGFTISDYDLFSALLASLIIAVVTFCICIGGLMIGKKAGTGLTGKAGIIGGSILIIIGMEIFIKNLI